MSKSYVPKEPRIFILEESYYRQPWIEGQSDGGVSTVPTLNEMITLTTSPNIRRSLAQLLRYVYIHPSRQSLVDSGHINVVVGPIVVKVVNWIGSEMAEFRGPFDGAPPSSGPSQNGNDGTFTSDARVDSSLTIDSLTIEFRTRTAGLGWCDEHALIYQRA
ncbi:hypothetical protein F52700_8640 [Fusarium sp. NRRL 52700]|nr:hypothetical protein F52700_8640 [Fusarium sp. NRRL 52700]